MGEPNEQAALSQLRALQSELELVDEQASAKVKCRVLLISLCCHRLCSVSRAGQVVQIENEAAKKRRPVYEQRQVRQGVRSPSYSIRACPSPPPSILPLLFLHVQERIAQLPRFWLTVLQRARFVCDLITAEDIPVREPPLPTCCSHVR